MPSVISPAEVMQAKFIALGLFHDPDVSPLGAWPIWYSGLPPENTNPISASMANYAALDGGHTHRARRNSWPGIQLSIRHSFIGPGYAKAAALAAILDAPAVHLGRTPTPAIELPFSITIDGYAYTISALQRLSDILTMPPQPEHNTRLFVVNFQVKISSVLV